VKLKQLEQAKWAERTVDFSAAGKGKDGVPAPRRDESIDEIQFLLPRGAELMVDDVLLYAPGK